MKMENVDNQSEIDSRCTPVNGSMQQEHIPLRVQRKTDVISPFMLGEIPTGIHACPSVDILLGTNRPQNNEDFDTQIVSNSPRPFSVPVPEKKFTTDKVTKHKKIIVSEITKKVSLKSNSSVECFGNQKSNKRQLDTAAPQSVSKIIKYDENDARIATSCQPMMNRSMVCDITSNGNTIKKSQIETFLPEHDLASLQSSKRTEVVTSSSSPNKAMHLHPFNYEDGKQIAIVSKHAASHTNVGECTEIARHISHRNPTCPDLGTEQHDIPIIDLPAPLPSTCNVESINFPLIVNDNRLSPRLVQEDIVSDVTTLPKSCKPSPRNESNTFLRDPTIPKTGYKPHQTLLNIQKQTLSILGGSIPMLVLNDCMINNKCNETVFKREEQSSIISDGDNVSVPQGIPIDIMSVFYRQWAKSAEAVEAAKKGICGPECTECVSSDSSMSSFSDDDPMFTDGTTEPANLVDIIETNQNNTSTNLHPDEAARIQSSESSRSVIQSNVASSYVDSERKSISGSQVITAVNKVVMQCQNNPAERLGLTAPICQGLSGQCVHAGFREIMTEITSQMNLFRRQRLYVHLLQQYSVLGCLHSFHAVDTLQWFIHFILNHNETQLVINAVFTLWKLLHNWPPCTVVGKEYYLQFLTAPNQYTNSQLGPLDYLLLKIEALFPEDVNEDSCNNVCTSDSNDEDCKERPVTTAKNPMTSKSAQSMVGGSYINQDYRSLPKDEQSSRVGALMEVVCHILEQDLLMYLTDNELKAWDHLAAADKQPLLVQLIWPTQSISTIGIMNTTSRRIVKLYLAATGRIRQTLARLIGIMAEMARASEHSAMLYPNVGTKCHTFAKDILNMIPDNTDVKSVVNELKPSWLSLLIVHHRISLLTESDLPYSIRVVSACLQLLVEYTYNQHCSPEKPSRVNKQDKKGRTRLHKVCRHYKGSELLSLLSEPDIDVNIKDNAGWTAFQYAAINGNLEAVENLLAYEPGPGRRPVDVHAKVRGGMTSFMYAAAQDEPDICEILLKHSGWCLLKEKDDCGESAKDFALTVQVEDVLRTARQKYKRTHLLPSLASRSLTTEKLSEISALLPDYVHFFILTYKLHEVNKMLRMEVPCDTKAKKLPKCKYKNFCLGLKNYKELKKLVKVILTEKNCDQLDLFDTTYSILM